MNIDLKKFKQRLFRRLLLLGILKPAHLGRNWWRLLKAEDVTWGLFEMDNACDDGYPFYTKLRSGAFPHGIFSYLGDKYQASKYPELLTQETFLMDGKTSLSVIEDEFLQPQGKTLVVEETRKERFGMGWPVMRSGFPSKWRRLSNSERASSLLAEKHEDTLV